MSEFKKTNLEFQKKIHNKKILNNYKISAEQWKKLYEDEHRRRIKLEEEIIMLKQEINNVK